MHLTDKGRETLAAADAAREQAMDQLTQPFGDDDEEELSRLLRELLGVSQPRSRARPGITIRAVSPCITTRGWTGTTSRPEAHSSSSVADPNGVSCSSVRIVGNTSTISLARVGVERALGVNQPRSTHSPPSGAPPTVRRLGEEEVRVEADADLRRCDPARELHERVRVGQLERGFLLDLAHARQPVRGVALALRGVDRATREHPRAAHEALLRVAPDQQHLERVGPAAQDDHRGGLARRRRLSGVELGAGLRSLRGHRLTLAPGRVRGPYHGCMTTETAQQWICESCGFIYDPAEGDPDGGIPPGTAFDDIPSDWYCPVCGARKADFSPYED